MYDDPFATQGLPKRKQLGDPNIPTTPGSQTAIGGNGMGPTGPSTGSNVPLAAQRSGNAPGSVPTRPPGSYAPGLGGQPPVGGYPTFGAGNNLINTQITPNPSGRLQNAQGMSDNAATAYANGGLPQFNTLAPINTGGYRTTLGQAAGYGDQMNLPQFQGINTTDYTATRQLLGGANANPSAGLQGLAGPGGSGSFGFAGDTSSARSKAMQELDKVLADDTNRGDLSAQAYQLMLERAAPGEAAEDRRLAQKTAALGRTRSGMFNSEQMDLATSRERTRDQARRELSMDAAQQALADRVAKLGAAQGLSSEFAGQDASAGSLNLGYLNANNAERGDAFRRMAGLEDTRFNRTLNLADRESGMAERTRAERVGERDTELGFAESRNRMLGTQSDLMRRGALDQYGLDVDNDTRASRERDGAFDAGLAQENIRRNRLGDLSQYERGISNDERANRDEVRGERGYQYGLDRDAQGDSVQQYQLEQDALDRRFRRGQDRYALGQGGDPYGALRDATGDYDAQATDAYGSAADLLGANSYRRQLGGAASGVPSRFPSPNIPDVSLPNLDLGGDLGFDGNTYRPTRRRRA